MHETDRAAHGWTKTKRLNPPMDRWQGHMDLHCEQMADVFPAQDRTWELEVQTPTSCQTQWTQCRSYHGQINCNNMHHHFQYTTAMVSFFFFFFCCCCYYQLLGKELNSLISNCYRSHSSCFSCWATSSKKPKAPSFQIGLGWNLAEISLPVRLTESDFFYFTSYFQVLPPIECTQCLPSAYEAASTSSKSIVHSCVLLLLLLCGLNTR